MRIQDPSRRWTFALCSLALCSLAASIHGSSAYAETVIDDDTVTVTGSRVPRKDLTSNSPILSIDEKAIERSGAVNIEDLLRKLPQMVAGISSGVNLGNPGVTTLNLRGLDSQRTLILVDGKRFVPYDFNGAVDVNNIPIALIAGIDIVTGGASAVYGSDATAGVVNFRLKKDFEGMEAGVHYMQTAESDGKTKDVTLTAGTNFAEGRGNVALHLGWTDRDPVSTADRDFSKFAYTTSTGALGGSVVDTQGTFFCIPSCYIPGFTGGQGYVDFASNGNIAPLGARLFNYNLYNYLQVPQERMQGTALLNFDLNDSISAYGRLTAAETRVNSSIAPSGTFFTRTFTIPLNSPSLNAQARGVFSDRFINGTNTPGRDGLPDPNFDTNNDGVIDANATVTEYFARRIVELGARETRNRTVAWQAVGGLQGDFASDWRWDASYQLARTTLDRAFTNDINEARMQASMLGCPPGSPAGCVVGNYFGDGNLSQEAANYIALNIFDSIRTDQQVFVASVAGDLGERLRMPNASAIGAAFGVEYRREKSANAPDDCLRTPGCSGGYGSVVPVRADYNVKELFGELLIPVLEDKSFAHRLDIETGVRFSDFSTVGTATAYKFGGAWAPADDSFRIRGMYQKAVRAPNIFEFGSPQQQNRGDASADPCSGTVSSSMRALCIATGVPASAISAGGVSTVPNVFNGQINVFEGGNPNLTEEDTDTWTVGFVWSPQALPGLNLALDWYRIRIDNAIDSVPAQDVLNACYFNNPSGDATSPACTLIFRNPTTGGLVGNPAYGISELTTNFAFIETEGVDLGVNYMIDATALGRFDIAFNATRVLKNDRKSASELPVRDCAGRYGASCGSPDPELRLWQQTNWTIGAFELGYRWRYLKEVSIDNPAIAVAPYRTMNDRQYVDLMLGWRPAQLAGLSIRLGIDNLLDKDPPLVGEDAGPTDRNSGNTYPGTYEVIGRSYFVSGTYQF